MQWTGWALLALGVWLIVAPFAVGYSAIDAAVINDGAFGVLIAGLAAYSMVAPRRLAEAFAERMHERVRRELWGYAPTEALSNVELIAERYQGIRPAPGYPACPDHTEKGTIFELLEADRRAGIRLTESYAMLPGASVSGYYFWNPGSRYFGLGRIGRDQLTDYARRKGIAVDEAARWLAPNLADEESG